jgi:hypothetical protein
MAAELTLIIRATYEIKLWHAWNVRSSFDFGMSQNYSLALVEGMTQRQELEANLFIYSSVHHMFFKNRVSKPCSHCGRSCQPRVSQIFNEPGSGMSGK